MSQAADRPILVTGGAGFIGSNLVDRLASEGNEVLVLDTLARTGVERNLAWLKSRHGERIGAIVGDVRDAALVSRAVKEARAVFHFAAQVAVTTSLAEPADDFQTNLVGTFNLLEAAREAPGQPPLIFASTNKVYGDLADLEFGLSADGYQPCDPAVRRHGIGEARPIELHTPYGCSKGGADQYVLDYHRSFGLRTAVLRMSCIYGQRQMGTEDQGWVAYFLIRALEGKPITIYGDGHQVRDILDVSNAVEAYLAAWRRIDRVAGRAFNLGGGAANAVSLRTLLGYIADVIGREPVLSFSDWRTGDQRYFVADARAARATLGLSQPVPWQVGVSRLASWLSEERGLAMPDDVHGQRGANARAAAL